MFPQSALDCYTQFMRIRMATVRKGYFLITDITGYTIFLTRSELDHAHHIIQALFQAQLASLTEPVQVSNFQGDAILCYLPEEAVPDGNFVLDQVRNIYRAFTREMAAMQVNPPCGCNACSNISTLDLKIFVHFGRFMENRVGDRTEILGSDVILAHRMMKNHIREATGIQSYLCLSEAAHRKLAPERLGLPTRPHRETYEHLGEVPMYVGDLVRL
ncbi:MAG: DUF2652 domain-containing protein [Candidatus Neomarinimicrobiota bacterium]|nr:MAG: DUF2652 domain-containing protein [Candidatus Neomarinimicrobiota bacterium]